MTAPTFIPHCDNHTCDLGSMEFQCPCCKKTCHDYDEGWWAWQRCEPWDKVRLHCDHCKALLAVKEVDGELEVIDASVLVQG